MIVPVLLLGIVLALLTAEWFVIRRAVDRIPLRILVTGTRGKSSVVRLLAAALRAARRRAMAKVTGEIPRLLLPDSVTVPVRRRGRARVQEQWRIIRRASREQVDALVLECMSITPELLRLESRIFRPHVFVLTNIRDDHREHVADAVDRVEAFCAAVPGNSVVVTGEQEYAAVVQRAAESKGSRSIAVGLKDRGDRQHDQILRTNVSLAEAALRAAGIDTAAVEWAKQEALQQRAQLVMEVDSGRGKIHFVNGFTVNDVESAQRFLEEWEEALGWTGKRHVVLNTRSDRPLRSRSFVGWLAQLPRLGSVAVIGSHARWTSRMLLRRGLPASGVFRWNHDQWRDPVSGLSALAGADSVVFGFGNAAGDGQALLEALGSLRAEVL